MNAPALVNVNIPSLAMAESELIKVLESSIYPGANLESIKLVVGWCRAQNKDPLKRPVHIVPMQVKQKAKKDGVLTNRTETVWRDVIMPGIGDCRTDAARTGEYAGISAATFGNDRTEKLGGEPKLEWDENIRAKVDTGKKYDALEFTFPEWCEISVFRMVQGVRCEFSSGKVYFKETYATAGGDTSLPNAMWRKRPRGQLEKCAEALALRRAFPEVGAQPTADEMAGRTIEAEGVTIDGDTGAVVPATAVQQPRARSEKPAEQPKAEPKTEGAPAVEPKPITAGAIKMIKASLERAGLSTTDLHAKFGVGENGMPIEGWTIEALDMSRVNEVLVWIKNPAGQ